MAKTLFNSSENSNFILNMTEEQYARITSYGMIGACILVPLFTILPEVSSTSTYTFASGGLVVAGVFAMITALIGIIKKYIKGVSLLPVTAFAAMLVWSVVSMLDSYDRTVGLYGYPQRGEGVMAIMFYCCIFVSAAAVKREKAVNTLMKGIMASGVINSLWALIQIFTGELSHYKMLSLDIEAHAASGLSQSPLFLAMLLTLALTSALISVYSSKSAKGKVICTVLAALFSFVMIFTYSVIGIAGIGAAVVLSVVSAFIMKAKKTGILSVIAVGAAALAAVLIIDSGNIGSISTYKFYDGRTLWWADSYMRASASGDVNPSVIDIDEPMDVYLYLDQKGKDMASRFPLTGTGPDQLVYPQLYTWGTVNSDAEMSDVIVQNKGTFDRVYNEYIYTAATRGIPSLLALLAVILPALCISFKAMKKKRTAESTALFILTLSGALLFLIGCSSLPFSPVYWAIAGLACADLEKEKKTESK